LTFHQDARPILFNYEKPVNVEELDNSEDLYMKIIKSKESIDYLKKIMEKKGVLKTKHNPLKHTRFN
jgi:hypothetical protein